MSRACVVAIGGTDATGGAGLAADISTIAAMGVHPAIVVTAVTAQDDEGLRVSSVVPPEIVAEQLEVVWRSCRPAAVKTGMLVNAETIAVVTAAVAKMGVPLVVDPVVSSSSGSRLLDDPGIDAMIRLLLPHASLIAPNHGEAAILAGIDGDEVEQARAIRALGAQWVVITGGHAVGAPVDLLVGPGGVRRFEGERIHTEDDRGTGCTFASAAAAALAMGEDMSTAVQRAHSFVRSGLQRSYSLANARGTLDRRPSP